MMNKKIPNNITVSIIIFCILFITAGVFAYTLNTWNWGWRVNNGSNKDVTYNTNNDANNPSTACVKVTNNSGHDLFVPTRTVNEKNAFCNNSGASCGACGGGSSGGGGGSVPLCPSSLNFGWGYSLGLVWGYDANNNCRYGAWSEGTTGDYNCAEIKYNWTLKYWEGNYCFYCSLSAIPISGSSECYGIPYPIY